MKKDVNRAWKKYPKGFVAHVEKDKVPPGGGGLVKYLAKYVVSPPISVRRIQSYDGQKVRYWYRDHKTGQIEHETLPVLRFIGRMVQHILPKGFQRIRYYGLHCNVHYQYNRARITAMLPAKIPASPESFRVLPRKPFEQLFLESFGRNPLLCPRCERPMELELIHHPDYGTLRSYELYEEAPPETCTARGPPLQRPQPVVQLPLPFM